MHAVGSGGRDPLAAARDGDSTDCARRACNPSSGVARLRGTVRSHVRHYAVPLSLISVALVLLVASASAAVPLTKISSDPYTNPSSQHKTQVEPDTFASGSTIVSAFQSGRFFDGGASNIGWATSTNGGSSWQNGFLPGITKYEGNGPYDRVSDPRSPTTRVTAYGSSPR